MLKGALLFALTATVFLLSAPLPHDAHAHSQLKSSTPASGAVLKEAPGEAVLVFNEGARVTSIRLFDGAGGRIALPGEMSRSPGKASIKLPDLPKGRYELEWRAISMDGHPVRGRVRFTVGGAR